MHTCKCGCQRRVTPPQQWISGHNLKVLRRTPAHRTAIAAGQRRAWRTKRQRLPIGSTQKDHDGYIRVKVVRGKGRWKLQHVIEAERMLNRPLRNGECVHHINGDRADNRPDNLYVCRDRAHHNSVHRSQDRAFRALLAAQLVVFRHSDGEYEAVLPR